MAEGGKPAITVAQSPPTASAPESADLLHDRLRLFTGLMGGIFVGLYFVGFVLILVFRAHHLVPAHVHPAKLMNAGAFVVMGAVWWFLRRRSELSLHVLQALDATIALAIGFSAILALSFVDVGVIAVIASLLLILLTLELRAALVPSPPHRTALIALGCTMPLVYQAYRQARIDPSLPLQIDPTFVAIGIGLWGLTITAATTVTSRIVYGLEREVREKQRLGQYTLLTKLGEGGMGAVYLARHAMLRRPTAVKLLLPQTGASAARFEREVQLTSMLTHPNTIAIYDYGRTVDGVFYYAMEYADGLSLEELVRTEGPQPAARVVHVLRQAAGALSEAHRLGLIHRDVKPANILLCEQGGVPDTVKVVDFGLVKAISTESESESDSDSDIHVTQANTITGTPAYLAPEMITSPDDVDGRADLYALGAVGYFMLTGEQVFDGNTVVEVCGHHLHTKPEPPSQRRGEPIDRDLERLVLSCLAKRKEDRPRSAPALETELARLAQQHPWSTDEAAEWWRRWRRDHPAHMSTSMTKGSLNISTRSTKKRTASAPSITR